MRFTRTLVACLLVVASLPLFGAAYIKFDGIDGEVVEKGHDKWIELTSVQFEGGSCNPTAGPRRATVSSNSIPQALVQACATRQKFRSVQVDADGQRHVLQNASIVVCPATTTAARFVIEFEGCGNHRPPARPQAQLDLKRGNALLIGLTPAPAEIKVTEASLQNKVASLTLAAGTIQAGLDSAITLATAQGLKYPSIIIKANDGLVWTFNNVMFSAVNGGPGTSLIFSFNFDSMQGPAGAFPMLGKK